MDAMKKLEKLAASVSIPQKFTFDDAVKVYLDKLAADIAQMYPGWKVTEEFTYSDDEVGLFREGDQTKVNVWVNLLDRMLYTHIESDEDSGQLASGKSFPLIRIHTLPTARVAKLIGDGFGM